MKTLDDPLCEITRKKRRALLAVSVLGVTLVRTGLIPTKISALGVEFDKANREALPSILAVVALYYLLGFVIYGMSDFLAWRRTVYSDEVHSLKDRLEQMRKLGEEYAREYEIVRESVKAPRYVFVLSNSVSYLRAFFDFVLPVVVGVYSIIVLIFRSL